MSYKKTYVPKKGEDFIVPEKFRIASNGRRSTRGLFFEVNPLSEYNFFTFKLKDVPPNSKRPEGLMSFPKLYLSYCTEDPTEYTFAIETFGSWAHWEMITECSDLKPYIEALRKEASVAIRAKAMSHIAKEVKTESKNAYAAAKWLAEKGWEPKETPTVEKTRRKTKAAKEAEKQEEEEALSLAKQLWENLDLPSPQDLN